MANEEAAKEVEFKRLEAIRVVQLQRMEAPKSSKS